MAGVACVLSVHFLQKRRMGGGHPMLECLSLAVLSIQALEDDIGVHVQGRAPPLIPSQSGTMMSCPILM